MMPGDEGMTPALFELERKALRDLERAVRGLVFDVNEPTQMEAAKELVSIMVVLDTIRNNAAKLARQ